jgi:hypothetical protein
MHIQDTASFVLFFGYSSVMSLIFGIATGLSTETMAYLQINFLCHRHDWLLRLLRVCAQDLHHHQGRLTERLDVYMRTDNG